jgi:hypothetical protein
MTDEPDFMDISETEDVRKIELPRWVQVPVGIVLSLVTLLCGFASAYLLFVPNKRAPILALVVGFILLLGCAWVLEKCFRLITGRKKRGGLMTPRALRPQGCRDRNPVLRHVSLRSVIKCATSGMHSCWRRTCVPGHAIMGRVTAVGSAFKKFRVGCLSRRRLHGQLLRLRLPLR